MHLGLASNRLTELPEGKFESLTKLTSLTLNDNRIRSINGSWFGANNSLAHLDIQKTNITELRRENLAHLTRLTFLTISQTQLSYIEPGSLIPLHELLSVDLTHNRLTQFNVTEQFTTVTKELAVFYIDNKQSIDHIARWS